MFDRPDKAVDPASDLDWLIQSDQAPSEIILEGLVQEFYPAVYFLAISILDSRPEARTLAADIFASAVNERHTYRSQIGARNWLYRRALEACLNGRRRVEARRSLRLALPAPRDDTELGDSLPSTAMDAEIWLALDALDGAQRAVALLYFLHDWSIHDLARLLESSEGEIESPLAAARQNITAAIQASLDSETPPIKDLDELVRSSLQRRWRRRVFTPEQLEEIAARISRRASKHSRRRRVVVSAGEIAIVLLVIAAAAGIFWGADRFFPDAGPTPTATSTPQVVHIIPRDPGTGPAPTLSPTEKVLDLPNGSYRITDQGDTWESIAAAMGTSAELVRSFNRIPSGVTPTIGMRLLDPGAWIHLYPGAMLPDSRDPLTQTMELAEALDLAPRYSTLWLEGLAIDYGPEAYIGPARAHRIQLWQARGRTLTLAGMAHSALPEEARLSYNGREWLARIEQNRVWFWPWELAEFEPGLLYGNTMGFVYALVERGYLSVQGDLHVTGRERIAGINALEGIQIREDYPQYSRFWVDDRTGLVLRQVFYDPQGLTPLSEFVVSRVAYNAPQPGELLTEAIPWRGSYAQDVTGAPEALGEGAQQVRGRSRLNSRRRPPDGFDPAGAQLTFQYPFDYSGEGPSPDVELFAGGYSLGKTIFGSPRTTICDRSPDGRWLAYVSNPDELPGSPETRLHYFSLEANNLRAFSIPGQEGAGEMAFSPDSRKLAFFMHATPDGPGHLMIANIEFGGGYGSPLLDVWDVRSLVWSPDGLYLAMIAHLKEADQDHVVVVDANNENQITYSAAIDIQSNRDQRDWPMLDWGVEFPVDRQSLDGCARPPAD